MTKILAAFVSCCLLFAATAMAAKKDEAFQINKRTFKKNYKVVALAPVDADGYLEMPDAVAAIIEQEVTARLKKHGYTVIPSSVLTDIRKTMESQVGGLENPETGRVSNAKKQAVRNHAYRELWFQQQFDALVTTFVSVTTVSVENDNVEWDGAKQKLAHEGRGKKYTAKAAVSSVAITFYDSSNKPLYVYYGGLEPIMYRDGEQLQPFTRDRLFLDEKRVRKAAQIALSPL